MDEEYGWQDVAYIMVKAFIIMLLWNWLMPKYFGIETLNYFEALGFYMLATSLLP